MVTALYAPTAPPWCPGTLRHGGLAHSPRRPLPAWHRPRLPPAASAGSTPPQTDPDSRKRLRVPLPPATVTGPARLRAQVKAALRRLVSLGALDAADFQLACQLAESLPLTQGYEISRAGEQAAALLLVLAASRQQAATAKAAAAAVKQAGWETTAAAVRKQLPLLQQHWQASQQWRELLGPPQPGSEDAGSLPASTPAVVGLLSLEAQAQQGLRRLASLGHLSAADLALALQLAQTMHLWYPVTPRRKVGVPVACLLQVVTLARGSVMTHAAAAAAVQEVGMEATAKAIGNRLRVLLKHWQESATWQQLLGPPPDTLSRPQARDNGARARSSSDGYEAQDDLLQLLERFVGKKLLRPQQAAPLAQLAPSLVRQYHRQYTPSTGTLGGSLLVLALQAEGLELPLANAAVAVELEGASASSYSLATALRKGEQLWQELPEWQEVLGPFRPKPTK